MSAPLRVLIVTDSFPPHCGGSGWSTWTLAHALMRLGHHVDVVHVRIGERTDLTDRTQEGIRVTAFTRTAPAIPVVRNFVKNERLWGDLTEYLTARIQREAPDIVHGQHVMSAVPAIRAGRATGTPTVTTVRDYWPVCYWSTLIVDPESPRLCPACTATAMTRCVRPRAGGAFPAAWSLIPYMRRNLTAKRRTLARSDAVIAVSSAIARDLASRAPETGSTSVYTIPNPVDMGEIDQLHAMAAPPTSGPYVVYAGKLAPNKGAALLLPALQAAQVPWPIVAVGDGPLRPQIEADARARGLDLRVTGWLPRHEALAWIRHATLLAFPSLGPESLSRVLLEAAALGTPVAAMNTGGTSDIIQPGVTGLLSENAGGFARDLARLVGDERLRAALGVAARADVHARFSAASVAERVEQVYRTLLVPRAA